jgi:hypothetical protein
MPQYGLCLRVTHTGKAGDSVHVSDIRDGVDLLASFRKAGPVYIPHPTKGGVAVLVYSGDVAVSFETGGIRKFIEGGYLTAEFVIGSTLGPTIFPEVQDEGVQVDPAAQILNFTGAGVTATQTAPGEVQIAIPGGGGAATHPGLPAAGLIWTASAHTGTASRVAAFDGGGAASYLQVGVDLQAWDADLDALAALAGTGIPARTAADTWAQRTIQGTAGNIIVTNGDGVAGNPTINIGANVGDVKGGGASTDHALVRWDGLTGTLVQDSNAILDDAGNLTLANGTTLKVDTIAESTANNGVVVNTIRNYGKLAADPGVGPAPSDGDTYYNTALRMNMVYDGFRSKWLSVESAEFHFGRDGNTAVNQYYRAADGRVMSSLLGWYAIRTGTVVSLGYTRGDSDQATFDIVQDGISIATVASAASAGRDVTLNADFNFGDILAVRNQAGGGNNTTTNVIGWIRVKWRA